MSKLCEQQRGFAETWHLIEPLLTSLRGRALLFVLEKGPHGRNLGETTCFSCSTQKSAVRTWSPFSELPLQEKQALRRVIHLSVLGHRSWGEMNYALEVPAFFHSLQGEPGITGSDFGNEELDETNPTQGVCSGCRDWLGSLFLLD